MAQLYGPSNCTPTGSCSEDLRSLVCTSLVEQAGLKPFGQKTKLGGILGRGDSLKVTSVRKRGYSQTSLGRWRWSISMMRESPLCAVITINK